MSIHVKFLALKILKDEIKEDERWTTEIFRMTTPQQRQAILREYQRTAMTLINQVMADDEYERITHGSSQDNQ